MTIDYANQIANLISQYLPYTSLSLGSSYTAESIAVASGKMTMTFSSGDYTILSDIINDGSNPNSVFTTSNFYLKNTIVSFEAYPEDSTSPYAFLVNFRLPHKLKKYDEVTPKDFTDTSYNSVFKVMKAEDPYQAIFYPTTSVVVETLTTGLGFLPVNYTEGFNAVKTITDEGANDLSFTFEDSEFYIETDVANIDTDYLPKINYYLGALKVMNAETFLKNLTDADNYDYLIVDSSSLTTAALRSSSNTSDSSYNAYSRTGFFDTNNNMVLYYILERNIDDSYNQTQSGSDITDKHIKMYEALTSILRQPLDSDSNKVMSSITIVSSTPNKTIVEGSVIIEFVLQFKSSYQDAIMIDIDIKDSYPIDSLKFNENIVDLT